jgi:hypothetical protein
MNDESGGFCSSFIIHHSETAPLLDGSAVYVGFVVTVLRCRSGRAGAVPHLTRSGSTPRLTRAGCAGAVPQRSQCRRQNEE